RCEVRGTNISGQEGKMKISVEIYNRTYTIVSSVLRVQVQQVAQLVNDKMQEIHEANKHLDTTKLAVLIAVNTMNDYVKLEEEYNELLQLIEEDKKMISLILIVLLLFGFLRG